MTIAVQIENKESADDFTKQLLIEVVSTDGSVTQHFTLKGGAAQLVHIHQHQSLRLTERFVDQFDLSKCRR